MERRREKEVRRDLERRGWAAEQVDEEVRRIVSPPPVVIERSSLDVRREMEVRRVNRDENVGDVRKETIPERREDEKRSEGVDVR